MKALIILTTGFEDVEGLGTIDVLRRSKINVTTASIDDVNITTQSGHNMKTMTVLKELDLSDYDFLVIPGGGAVFNILDKEQIINDVIDYFYFSNKLICAICAAPLLIGKRGYFKNMKYTCFPGCENRVTEGIYTGKEVEVSERFILGRSMYYSLDFALAIIERVQGKKQRETVEASIKGLK